MMLALVSALSGCSLLLGPPPPASATNAVDSAVDAIRDLEGVASASSTLSPIDMKDGGPLSEMRSWSASILVDLEPDVSDLGRLATEVEAQLSSADGTVSTAGTVRIPADLGGPAATLRFERRDRSNEIVSPSEMAAAVTMLRAVDGAQAASVSQGDPVATVDVVDPARWAGVAAELRQLPGFGVGALTAVSIPARSTPTGRLSLLKIDATSPHPSLIPVLGELAGDDDVLALAYEGTGVVAVSSTAPLLRPRLRVEVSGDADVERVTALLTSLDDAQTSVAGVGRAAFRVSSYADGTTREREGFVGLPLGSAEPDDLVDAPTAPDGDAMVGGAPAIVLDPAAADARVADDRLAVMSLLEAAGDVSGIRGTADAGIATCETGVGEQVLGSVVIPIFEIADSADDAFAAITTAWIADGYTRTDRASGTDFYSAADLRGRGATSLAIRGTADGISIRATSTCIVSE